MAHALLDIRNLAWQSITRFKGPFQSFPPAKLRVSSPLWSSRGFAGSHNKKPGLLRSGHSWTQEELDQLWQLRSAGKRLKEIGFVLGRSVTAIEGVLASGRRSAAAIKRAPWTEAEKKLLIERHQQGVPYHTIADELGRGRFTLSNMLRALLPPSTVSTGRRGQPAPRRWTQDELDRARAMRSEGQTTKSIGAILGRTANAVQLRLQGAWGKASPNVLNQKTLFTPAEDQELRRLCSTLTCMRDVARAMPSRARSTLSNRAKTLGIRSTRESFKHWTEAEIDLLRTLKLQRLSWEEIALRIPSRTVRAIKNKVRGLRDLNS